MRLHIATLLVCLLSTSASAATRPDIYRMVSTNPASLDLPVEGREFYRDWRAAATRWTELLSGNREVARRVGEPLDAEGLRCILWTKMADFAQESLTAVRSRASSQNRALPRWLENAPERARQRAKDECNKPGNGPDGHPRAKNLGLRYLEELARSSPSKRAELVQDDDLLEHLGNLAAALHGIVQSLPARAGAAAASSATVPIIDPRIFLRRDCGSDCST